MLKNISPFFMACVVVLLQACSEKVSEDEQRLGRYGMLDPNTPHYTAVKWFEHIYSDDNLNGAVELSTPRMAKLLRSYHTNRNVQRHVLNLTFDDVNLQPDTGNSVARSEYAQKAVVTMFFAGTRNGDKYEDIRVVELSKVDNDWKVSKVRADKYL